MRGQNQLGGLGGFVGGVEPGELLDLAGSCPGIEALGVAGLADLQRGGDVKFLKTTLGMLVEVVLQCVLTSRLFKR